jgi:hypothetical protein
MFNKLIVQFFTKTAWCASKAFFPQTPPQQQSKDKRIYLCDTNLAFLRFYANNGRSAAHRGTGHNALDLTRCGYAGCCAGDWLILSFVLNIANDGAHAAGGW